MAVSLILNRKRVTLDVDASVPLLWAIRECAGLDRHKIRVRNCTVWRLHLALGRKSCPFMRDPGFRSYR